MKTKAWDLEFPEIAWIKDRLTFAISPRVISPPIDIEKEITDSLSSPIESSPLRAIVAPGSRVLLLADDMTRLTPRALLIPPILDQLNKAGVEDAKIQVLIALGTHRAMREREIEAAFGKEVIRRVEVINHDFRDPRQLVRTGRTKHGTPIIINRRVLEADFVLGIGSIVPHPEAGWSGGAKIFQPGICSEETTAWTHMLAARQPDHLALAGVTENPVRLEIEEVAQQGGLRFVVNVVFDGAGKVVKLVAGDPIAAHRVGVSFAKEIFMRPIPSQADVVVVDARPADIDYWQGIKPLAFATRAVTTGGVVILVGRFPDAISPIYDKEVRAFGRKTRDQLRQAEASGALQEGVCTEALYLHSSIMGQANVVCVSNGMNEKQKAFLGFHHADTLTEALERALEEKGVSATVGVILQGGDVLPYIDRTGEKGDNE